ncbi:MAG TPA: zinc ribbon domain-containing protein [Solirubrobacterales bacterium]|nr:zinc ribbon domain-containing protein [Solirubrobacterales bacterium]
MPLYEFECGRCGSRFEELVAAGTQAAGCRSCGAEGARRVYSAPGAPFRLVKAPGEARRQERRNAELRERTSRRAGAARDRRRPDRGKA